MWLMAVRCMSLCVQEETNCNCQRALQKTCVLSWKTAVRSNAKSDRTANLLCWGLTSFNVLKCPMKRCYEIIFKCTKDWYLDLLQSFLVNRVLKSYYDSPRVDPKIPKRVQQDCLKRPSKIEYMRVFKTAAYYIRTSTKSLAKLPLLNNLMYPMNRCKV